MDILYKLLQNRCDEIKTEGEKKEKIDKVIDAYYRVLDFADEGRKEGLLALDFKSEGLDMNDRAQAMFFSHIQMVVDGTEPKLLKDIMINELITSGLSSYEGLMALMYLRGSIMIQGGDTTRVIEMMMKSLLPDFIRKELGERECEKEQSNAPAKEENKIAELCKDNSEPDETDHSLINQTALTLINLSDQAVQRLLRDVNNNDIVFMMVGLPGKARKRVFDNLSPRLGEMIAEDVKYLGPVRLRDVEEACAKVMKILVSLVDGCEIIFDETVLKVVLDIYENAEKKNAELREEYRELKKIIDNIYKGK